VRYWSGTLVSFFSLSVFFAKLRWLNYLSLRSITLPFCLFSIIYGDARKLIIRWFQVQVLVGPPFRLNIINHVTAIQVHQTFSLKQVVAPAVAVGSVWFADETRSPSR